MACFAFEVIHPLAAFKKFLYTDCTHFSAFISGVRGLSFVGLTACCSCMERLSGHISSVPDPFVESYYLPHVFDASLGFSKINNYYTSSL